MCLLNGKVRKRLVLIWPAVPATFRLTLAGFLNINDINNQVKYRRFQLNQIVGYTAYEMTSRGTGRGPSRGPHGSLGIPYSKTAAFHTFWVI